MDTPFYILGLIIMALMFAVGYRIGYMKGWRHGGDASDSLTAERAAMARRL